MFNVFYTQDIAGVGIYCLNKNKVMKYDDLQKETYNNSTQYFY